MRPSLGLDLNSEPLFSVKYCLDFFFFHIFLCSFISSIEFL